jgi:hypothetical protein
MLPPLGSIAFGCPVRAHAKPARRGIVEVTAEGQIRDDDTDTDSEAFGQPCGDRASDPGSRRAAEDVLHDDAAVVVVLALNGTQ